MGPRVILLNRLALAPAGNGAGFEGLRGGGRATWPRRKVGANYFRRRNTALTSANQRASGDVGEWTRTGRSRRRPPDGRGGVMIPTRSPTGWIAASSLISIR